MQKCDFCAEKRSCFARVLVHGTPCYVCSVPCLDGLEKAWKPRSMMESLALMCRKAKRELVKRQTSFRRIF